jgi:uncharacterized membrane protein YgcG
MASGFLLADALNEALRRPYHQGDLNVTMQYVLDELAIGPHRVMLKRNFDTACWIPPVGKRDSHTIYYGDRMLARVVERFCRVNEVPVPDDKMLAEGIVAELNAKRAAELAKGKKVGPEVTKASRSAVYDAKLTWLKTNLSAAEWKSLLDTIIIAVAAYGRHERQHARETPRDMKVVNQDLKTLGIPFSYFNLFEDARIEHISRQEMGVPFDWNAFEDMAPMTNPQNLLLRCIQNEGEPDTDALDSEEPYGDGTRTMGHVADSVQGYYRRALECANAEYLYPIIQEFLEEFKHDLPPPEEGGGGGGGGGSGSGGGESGESGGEGGGEGGGESEGDGGDDSGVGERAGDLSTAAEAAETGDEFFDEFESDAEVVGGTDAEGTKAEEGAKAKLKGSGSSEPPKGKGSGGQGIPESIKPSSSGGRANERDFLASIPGKIDGAYAKRVEALTAMLMRMFKSHTLPAATETIGKRISSRHLARGEFKFIHKKVFGGKGKRRYTIIFDCSGSMGMHGGRPTREGKLLLLALNNLAKRGYLQGSLILSGHVGGKPSWLQYEFPVAERIIMSIQPEHGAEGIQTSLADNLKHIKGTDDVFVYTDACITDTPLDRAYFAKHQVWPVGLYVGKKENAEQMDRHFPQNIIRDTIEEVVAVMLTRNRRTVG